MALLSECRQFLPMYPTITRRLAILIVLRRAPYPILEPLCGLGIRCLHVVRGQRHEVLQARPWSAANFLHETGCVCKVRLVVRGGGCRKDDVDGIALRSRSMQRAEDSVTLPSSVRHVEAVICVVVQNSHSCMTGTTPQAGLGLGVSVTVRARRATSAGTRAQNLTVSELLTTLTGMCKISTIPNTVDEMTSRASHAQYSARPLNLRHNPRRLLW